MPPIVSCLSAVEADTVLHMKITRHKSCCDYWTVYLHLVKFSRHISWQQSLPITSTINQQQWFDKVYAILMQTMHQMTSMISSGWLMSCFMRVEYRGSWLFWVCVSSTGLVSCTWSASTAMSRAKEERVWRWCRTNPTRTPTTARDSSLRNAFISTSE